MMQSNGFDLALPIFPNIMNDEGRDRALLAALRSNIEYVKSRGTTTPISRPITTPRGLSLSALSSCVRGGLGAVGKWPAGATAKSLAQAGHLSTA
jgi:hypothetical protein